LAMNSSNTNREKNEMLCMRIKLRMLNKAYKQVFKQVKQATTSVRLISQPKLACELARHHLNKSNNSSRYRALPNAHICN
jgi:hypothetical protein